MKQKIQKSMMLILLVTLFPFYVIMTVILYNQNLGILEKEVQQEAVYLSSGVDVAGEEYLKKLEPMIKADEDTRLTFISQSGDVLYDSDSSKKLENHKSRAEVKQALAEGQGEDIRMSDTVGKELYYCAIRLDDGSVLACQTDGQPDPNRMEYPSGYAGLICDRYRTGVVPCKLADEASDGTGDASGSGASSGQCDLS